MLLAMYRHLALLLRGLGMDLQLLLSMAEQGYLPILLAILITIVAALLFQN
jgi:hypothetical protein